MYKPNLEIRINSDPSNIDGWHKLQWLIVELRKTKLKTPQIKIIKEAELYLYQSSCSLPESAISEAEMREKLAHRRLVGRLIG